MFLNNRHYDPATGTFLSVDPLVSKTMQPYIYGAANPVTYSDPHGLDPDTRADVRAEAERRGGCTYSSTVQACQGRPRVHGPTRWTQRRTTKANTWGPGGRFHTEETVFYDPPTALDLSGQRPAGNPHRLRVTRNGVVYVGGYRDFDQTMPPVGGDVSGGFGQWFAGHTVFDEMALMLEAAELRASGADSRPGLPTAVPPSVEPLLEDEFIQGLEYVTGLYVTGVGVPALAQTAGQGATTGAGQWVVTRSASVGGRAGGNARVGVGPSVLGCYYTD